MKAVEAVFVIALVAIACVAAWQMAKAAWRLTKSGYRSWRASRHPPWHMVEEADGELVEVVAESGEERLLIGAVPFAAEDFDSRLYGLRAEGRAKVYTLNEGRR